MMPMKNFLIYNVDSKKSYVCSNKEIQNGTLEQQLKKKKEGQKCKCGQKESLKKKKRNNYHITMLEKRKLQKDQKLQRNMSRRKKLRVKQKLIDQLIRKEGEKDQQNKFNNILQQAIVKVKPNVNWSDIADLESAKLALNEAVLFPIKFPHFFEGARKPWKGILIKKKLASSTFFSITSTDLVSQQEGEIEQLIKTLFTMAREQKPSIIFIDKINSPLQAQEDVQNDTNKRVITEFLRQMLEIGQDNIEVLILGATNLPWALDTPICKRFEKKIYIPLPDKQSFQDLSDILNQILVYQQEMLLMNKLGNFNQPKIQINHNQWLILMDSCCRQRRRNSKIFYGTKSKRYCSSNVCYCDFLLALKKFKKSVSLDQLREYEKWSKQFGQES
ncbi:unnamed protein product [Paramecium sonneborni]|uniref:Cell division protein n=1 Tax=Paramecium sonneborni TaxID=65129 RepID=A0A8S1RJX6_9CILI|nr:unnamed protein product [Paramecium sonneborni]